MPSEVPESIARLLESSIQSVERLEVLCLLRATRPKTFTARAVATELSMAIATAESALAMLCGRGFLTVSIASDLYYSYAPISTSMDAMLAELIAVYARDRGAVLRVLRQHDDRDPVSAFAKAFVVRKKRNDDG